MLTNEIIKCYRDYIKSYNISPDSKETTIRLMHLENELSLIFDMFRANRILNELIINVYNEKINAENRLLNVERMLDCGEM